MIRGTRVSNGKNGRPSQEQLDIETAWQEGSEGPKKLTEANWNDRPKNHGRTKRQLKRTIPSLERREERLIQLPHENRMGREQHSC